MLNFIFPPSPSTLASISFACHLICSMLAIQQVCLFIIRFPISKNSSTVYLTNRLDAHHTSQCTRRARISHASSTTKDIIGQSFWKPLLCRFLHWFSFCGKLLNHSILAGSTNHDISLSSNSGNVSNGSFYCKLCVL